MASGFRGWDIGSIDNDELSTWRRVKHNVLEEHVHGFRV